MLKKTRMVLGMAVIMALALSVSVAGFANGSNANYLLVDDFKGSDIGEAPNRWRLAGQDFATFEVVEDSQTESGRAVLFTADDEERKVANMRVTFSEAEAAAANTIAVEHKVKWVQGRSINLYVTKSSHRLHWTISDGGLGYRDGSRSHAIALLENGWNTIRLVANRDANQAFIYVNDMENPVAGPLTFRTAIDSWVEAELIFAATTNPGEPTEILFGDVKVWAVD